MGNRKWPNDSLKTQANQIRKRYKAEGKPIPSDTEILQIFINSGKIKAVGNKFEKTPKELPEWPSNDHVNTIPEKQPQTRSITKSQKCHKSSPDPNDDSAKALMDLDNLPPGLKEFLQVTATAQSLIPTWKPTDTADYIRNPPKMQAAPEIITYSRSTIWSSKQHEIMNHLQIANCAIEGDKQTGKTTCTYAGIIEDCILNERHWHFFAQNGNNAQRLYIKARDDKPNAGFKPYYAAYSSTKCTIKNIYHTISIFEIHNTTINDVSGCTGNIWIDEVDKVLKDNPQVIGTAVALLRSNPELRLVFSMNKGSGVYQLLVEKLKKWSEESGKTITLNFLLLEKKDAPWAVGKDVTELAERDEFIGDIMEVCMGEDFVKQQLENADTSSGDAFNYVSLQDAYDMYDTYWQNIGMKYPSITHMAIDPSGTGHPFGVFIGAYDPIRDEHLEVESFEMQMGDPNTVTREKQSPNRINEILLEKCQKYNIKKVCIESNSGGQAIAIFLRSHNIQVVMQNFGAKTAFNSRANYVKLANYVLDGRKIVLKYAKLKSELTIYNPDIDKGEHKGDAADAFLHYLWLACGGMAYLMREAKSKSHTQTDSKFSAV